MLVLYSHMLYHNDTIIKTQEDFFRKICTSHFIVRVRKGYSRFYCERELATEQKLQYFDPHSYGRQRCVFLVLQGCSTGGPEAHSQLDDSFLYCILSATSLDPNSIGGPEPLRPGVAFPTTSCLLTRLISNCL